MMFSSKVQKLFVESAFLDRRSVYFYPISMQKCSLLCLYWEYEKFKIFYLFTSFFYKKKNPLHVHDDMCIGFFRRSMVCCYFFRTGSQVRLTPNFLKIFWSTSLSMTVQWTWQPRNLGSCWSARWQFSSFSERTESATSTSSVCRRGLCPLNS